VLGDLLAGEVVSDGDIGVRINWFLGGTGSSWLYGVVRCCSPRSPVLRI
jgi:hypothetical protein